MSAKKKTRRGNQAIGATAVGFTWYRREEWPRLLAVAADRETLEGTYDEWLTSAQETFDEIVSRGIRLEKVNVSIDELVEWCKKG